MSASKQILVIDPGCFRPEVDCFNQIADFTPLKCHYHLPAIRGMETLQIANYRQDQLAGIIILGSASSVNDAYEWQIQLRAWLMPYLQAKIPTLGLCFGHQLLSFIFDSKVDYVQPDREKLKGFRALNLVADELWGNSPQLGECFVSHCEVVTNLGTALRTLVEADSPFHSDAIRHCDLPIWGFQGHLEATPTFAANHGFDITSDTSSRLQFGQRLLQHFLSYCQRS